METKSQQISTLKVGSFVLFDGVALKIIDIQISKTGKHGHAKVRLEAIGIIDGKKRIIVVPGSERISVPLIEKRRAQVLSIKKEKKKASVMDLESYETLEVTIDPDLIEDIKESTNVEYWDVEGQKIIKRLL